jgi:hypothetical protein
MSASLIGRLGVKHFQTTTTVSMSLTGSCFSSESAALPSVERQVQADIRTHLIHRPARDIFPPLGGARVSFSRGRGSKRLEVGVVPDDEDVASFTGAWIETASRSRTRLRVSRDREHGFHRIVSSDFRGSLSSDFRRS